MPHLGALNRHHSHQVVVWEGLFVPALTLHLGLQLGQLVVGHLYVAGANVACVDKVGGFPNHGSVQPPPSLYKIEKVFSVNMGCHSDINNKLKAT